MYCDAFASVSTVSSINPIDNSVVLSTNAGLAGAYTLNFVNSSGPYSGGTLVIDANYRSGTAFEVTGSVGVTLLNNYEYDWQIGYHLGMGAYYNHLVSNSVDGTLGSYNPTNVAFQIDGDAYGNDIIGGYNIDYGIPLLMNSTDTTPQAVTAMRIGATNRYSVFLNKGALALTSVAIVGGNPFYVSDAAAQLIMSSMDIGGLPFIYQTPNDAFKVSGDSGAWASMAGAVAASSGTFGTASGVVRYKKVGRLVSFNAVVIVTDVGSATGSVTITMPFAVASATSFGGREILRGYALGATMAIDSNALIITNYDGSGPAISGGYLAVSGTYESQF